MKKKNGLGKAIVWGAAAAAAGVAAKKAYDNSKKKQEEKVDNVSDQVMENRSYEGKNAYFVGGGLGSMAGAAYLIRDCKFRQSRSQSMRECIFSAAAMMESVLRKADLYAAAAEC